MFKALAMYFYKPLHASRGVLSGAKQEKNIILTHCVETKETRRNLENVLDKIN